MCILFLYTDSNPKVGGYRFIVASNRDEFYKRPSKSAYQCKEFQIIGGRDMELGREGGMWLGISTRNKKLRFGALLNVTGEEKKSNVQARGEIVYNYLKNDISTFDYLEGLNGAKPYNAFNLITTEMCKDGTVETTYYSNMIKTRSVFEDKQILGFGNSTNVPLTKVKDGRNEFEEIVHSASTKEELLNKLLVLLKNRRSRLPDEELKRRAPQMYQHLSSIFVEIAEGDYGTRTHSIILVDYDWNVEFIENTMQEPIILDSVKWKPTVIKSHL